MATIFRTNDIVDSSLNLNKFVLTLKDIPFTCKFDYFVTNTTLEIYNGDITSASGEDPVQLIEDYVNANGDTVKVYRTKKATAVEVSANTTKIMVGFDKRIIGPNPQSPGGSFEAVPFNTDQFILHKSRILNTQFRLTLNYIIFDFDLSLLADYTNIQEIRMAYNKKAFGNINNLVASAQVITMVNLQGTSCEGEISDIADAAADYKNEGSYIEFYGNNSGLTCQGATFTHKYAVFDGQGGYVFADSI